MSAMHACSHAGNSRTCSQCVNGRASIESMPYIVTSLILTVIQLSLNVMPQVSFLMRMHTNRLPTWRRFLYKPPRISLLEIDSHFQDIRSAQFTGHWFICKLVEKESHSHATAAALGLHALTIFQNHFLTCSKYSRRLVNRNIVVWARLTCLSLAYEGFQSFTVRKQRKVN